MARLRHHVDLALLLAAWLIITGVAVAYVAIMRAEQDRPELWFIAALTMSITLWDRWGGLWRVPTTHVVERLRDRTSDAGSAEHLVGRCPAVARWSIDACRRRAPGSFARPPLTGPWDRRGAGRRAWGRRTAGVVRESADRRGQLTAS